MKISVEEAREYFAMPKQLGPVDAEFLPGEPFKYFAKGGICALAHEIYEDVWMLHLAADRRYWGRLDRPAMELLHSMWRDLDASSFVAWIPEQNRAVLSFASRIGFFDIGKIPMKTQTIVQKGWLPCLQ